MKNQITGVAWLIAVLCVLGCDSSLVTIRTCKKCGRTEVVKNGRVQSATQKSLNTNCVHSWEPGSFAYPAPIPSERVVVVRRGAVYGAFMIQRQRTDPEAVVYDFGFGTNAPNSRWTFGKGSGRRIKFGPFDIPWSGRDGRTGWIYYDDFVPRNDAPALEICVTDEVNITSNVVNWQLRFRKWPE